MPLNQSKRLIRMTKGPLAPDEVVVTGFSGDEAISRPFDFVLEFISTKLDLKPKDVIGKDLTIELDRRDKEAQPIAPRYFHGYINRFAAGEVVFKEPGEHKYRRYRAGMVPWLWFLSKTARCFLFFPEKKEKSIFEVIEAVFNRAKSDLHVDPVSDLKGINDLKNRKVEHCVQYRETDLNFVSRTMEKYGVFYYFKFEDGKHTLVLDMKKNYPACEEAEVVFPSVSGGQPTGDIITDWQHSYRFVSGRWSYTDYNFETPSTSLKASVPKLPAVDVPQGEKYEVYDYPGEYAVQPDGESCARVRQEEEEVHHAFVDGASTCRTFAPGFKFKLATHPDDDVASEHGKSYLLTSVTHSASQSSDDTGDSAGASYANRFSCIADSMQFRPVRSTPQPVISGVQTAVVVGPAGEEIYTDKYGRVKVQFHWDRIGGKNENSSCWIRVSSPWAGKAWGGISIPRIGQEVIVDFLEGDPDQPIVTGRVYNAEQMPPYELPANMTQSGVKSRSSKGGDGANFNEIRFEDKKGSEQLFIHAEKNQDIEVENDETHWVGHDRKKTIDNDETTLVKGNRTETVDKDETITIHGKRTETVDKDETITIHGNRTETVDKDEKITIHGARTETVDKDETITIHGGRTETVDKNETISIKGARTETVDKNETITIKGARTESVDKDETISIKGNRTETVDKNETITIKGALTEKVDKDETHNVTGGRTTSIGKDDGLKVGKNYIVDAGDSITIKTGSASISMKKDGTIVIKGKDITIEGGGKINAKASKDIVMKGAKILQN
jgi:type VI secretion system secreted protein VgrG